MIRYPGDGLHPVELGETRSRMNVRGNGGDSTSGGFLNGLTFAIVGMTVISSSIQLMPGPIPASGDVWEIETVVPNDLFLGSSLAFDGNDSPHISYVHAKSISQKYATLAESGWIVEFVDSRKLGGHSGCTSITVARDGHPHMSYDLHPPHGGYEESDLRYAWRENDRWNVQIIDTEGDVGSCSSIALDSNGYPRIAYQRNYRGLNGIVGGDLKYAAWNGTAWNIEVIEHASGYVAVTQRSLAMDRNDNPHIGYSARIGDVYYAKYAKWNGSDWEIEAVDPLGHVWGHSSLALDSSGYPHVSYFDSSNGSLKYARRNGSAWGIEVVDSSGDIGNMNSLALDSADRPHIAYADWGTWDLKYARRICSTWKPETVDATSSVSHDISLALNDSEYPHISYADFKGPWEDYDLKYAYRKVMDEPLCSVSLDVDPDTLNLKSRGRWITAYLSSENASVYNIDISSVRLQDTLMPERWDYQGEILMLKFNRQEFKKTVAVGESVEVKVSGMWKDGSEFQAYDHIRVIDPPMMQRPPWNRNSPAGIS